MLKDKRFWGLMLPRRWAATMSHLSIELLLDSKSCYGQEWRESRLVDVGVEAWVDGIELATDGVYEDGANCSEGGKEEENAAKADE